MATRSLGNSIAADDAIDLEAMRKEDSSWHPCHVSLSIAADNAIELEAMRKEDLSWHPCRISLSSSGVGLVVDCGSTDLEDVVIKEEEEMLARLRVRSVPLHGDDCILVQEGEHVLATPKLRPKSLFFDAAVEKVLRVRHSKKVYCRCTFTIRWLHQDLKGESLTVPSGSIMKLATRSIYVHPTISAFFSSLKSLSFSSPSPPSVVEDMDNEMDLHELLEKQIEEISNSADITKKRIPGNTLVGIEVDNNGQVQRRVVSGLRVSKPLAPVLLDQNHMKRTTRSARKLQMEIEANDPPPTALIQGELSESRSPLNPLAARAALASLVSQMPKSLETSNYEENLDSSDDITCKHDVLQSLKGTKTCSSPIGCCLSGSDKFSLETAATTVVFDPDHHKDVKPLHPTNGSTEQPVLMDAYSRIPINRREIKTNGAEIPDSSISCSAAKRKLSLPLKTTRLTRSQTERGAASGDDTIEQKTCLEEKPMSAANTRRFTRSAIRKGGEPQPIKGVQAMEEDVSGQVVGNGDSCKRPKRKCTSK
ncbi:uncharacterized protein LOC127791093 isoform X2 [Diospyros lotus]|uniref:uncharacterized protein LOC127791093 isoform X2 n=1 Tax=Diospyros lotus TaxID=55363 RepID=UPI0022567C05|nr:uncharacterized protein LOC127791093 isoform X2 [Diospyros lotus]